MVKNYLFIKRNRIRKKIKIYRLLYSLIFDWTTIVYTLAFLGYFFVAAYKGGDVFPFIMHAIEIVTSFIEGNFWRFISVLPVAALFQSFRQPGVAFTSAEYVLTILPNSRYKIWFLTAIEKWVKAFIILSLIGALFNLFTTLSLQTILVYILATLLLYMLMTPIQWKVFQLHFMWKLLIISGAILLQIAGLIISQKNVAFIFCFLSIVFAVISVRFLFRNVHWMRVTSAGDFAVWNMPFISQATKIKFKKDKQIGIWQRFAFWKKPFSYDLERPYNRLWYLYIEKNIALVAQMIGTLLLLLSIFSYFHQWYFMIALILSLYILRNFLLSIFKDRLQSDIVASLPWHIKQLKYTFLHWATLLSIILLAPVGIYTLHYYSAVYVLPMILLIMYTFYQMIAFKLNEVIYLWDETFPFDRKREWFIYILFVMLFLSVKLPSFILIGVILFGLNVLFRRR